LGKTIARVPVADIERVIDVLFEAYAQGRTTFLYGNGGSAALASHHACDIGKGTIVKDRRRFRVVSLTDNVPLITAWANDYGYDRIFVEQLRNLAGPNDVSFAISGSGNSPNVLNALQYSREVGALTVGVTGFNGGKMLSLCDVCVVVPSNDMQIIEDIHVSISHAVFAGVRQRIVGPAIPIAKAASM
jgi:D-sedoheptulose 7-phosphate isomerase